MRVRVSSDSTCDLSGELLARAGIAVTPLYIVKDGQSLRDGAECTPEDIFASVAATGRLCTTSAVTIGDYLDFFGRELQDCDQLVHFTISSGMSFCYQNACTAAAEFPTRVFVVDSRSLSTGVGHLALDAAALAAAGRSGAEIQALLEEKRGRLNVSFVLDTLDYIYKGGRCSGVALLGANLLNLKPCIEVRDGAMAVGKKYRGAQRKVLDAYLRDRLQGRDDVDTSRVILTESGVEPALVQELLALLGRLAPFREILHTRAGCAISNHCGPNCLGILYYNVY